MNQKVNSFETCMVVSKLPTFKIKQEPEAYSKISKALEQLQQLPNLQFKQHRFVSQLLISSSYNPTEESSNLNSAERTSQSINNNHSIATTYRVLQLSKQILLHQLCQQSVKASDKGLNNILNNSRIQDHVYSINQFFPARPFLIKSPQYQFRISAKSWQINVRRKKFDLLFLKGSGFNNDKKCEMASITKVMTFYTCLFYLNEHRIDPKLIQVKIPSCVETEGTSANLVEGDVLTLQSLFYGLMLPSGNDAAIAISMCIGFLMQMKLKKGKTWEAYQKRGGIVVLDDEEKEQSLFIYLNHMNSHAERLGMRMTRFTCVHGLSDPNNFSTASDLLILAEKCLQFSICKEVARTDFYQVGSYEWINTNKLLRKGWSGLKTGNTNNAGPCFCGYWENSELEVLIIILKCQSTEQRWSDAEYLLKQVVLIYQ